VAWSFRFSPPELSERVQWVVAEILYPDCRGAPLFATEVSSEQAGAPPPELASGSYGFRGRALSSSCLVLADACLEVKLPREAAIEVLLEELDTPRIDASCTRRAQEDGGAEPLDANDDDRSGTAAPDGQASDAGLERESGARADEPQPDDAAAGETDAQGDRSDVGVAPESKASFDPSASKCTNLDRDVVACFDFEDSLLDSSSHGNHAFGQLVSFEPGLSGKALRVGGQRVAIADAPSLNFTTFTIELWLRSDGLSNLLDKDAQYVFAYQSNGSLRTQLHRGGNNFEVTASKSDIGLTTGVFTYLSFGYDGSVIVFYKDGDRVDSKTVGVTLSRGVGAAMHIGTGSPNATLGFDGVLDAVRISNIFRGDDFICRAAGRSLTGGRCE